MTEFHNCPVHLKHGASKLREKSHFWQADAMIVGALKSVYNGAVTLNLTGAPLFVQGSRENRLPARHYSDATSRPRRVLLRVSMEGTCPFGRTETINSCNRADPAAGG